MGQPARALALLEPELQKRRDPALLAMAGVASWRADDSRHALEYWREALDAAPNPGLEQLYKQVQREQSNDQSSEKLYGVKVVLRYDSGTIPVDTARAMVKVVDSTYARVSSELGCAAEEKIVTIVQSRDAYRKATDAAVKQATEIGYLRQNSVDSLTGKNSGTNLGPGSPVYHFEQWSKKTVEVRLIMKGGGCENCGIQYSLPNAQLGAGRDIKGVEKCILDAVYRAHVRPDSRNRGATQQAKNDAHQAIWHDEFAVAA